MAKAHDRHGFPIVDDASLAAWEKSLARQQLYDAVEAYGGWFGYLMGKSLRIGDRPQPLCEMASYLSLWRPSADLAGGSWYQYWFTTSPTGIDYYNRKKVLPGGKQMRLNLRHPGVDSSDSSSTSKSGRPRVDGRIQGAIDWSAIQSIHQRITEDMHPCAISGLEYHYFGLTVIREEEPELYVFRTNSVRMQQEWLRCLECRMVHLASLCSKNGENSEDERPPDSPTCRNVSQDNTGTEEREDALSKEGRRSMEKWHQAIQSQQVPAGKYYEYLRRVSGDFNNSQILLDLHRTVPSHQCSHVLIPKLSRVLHAYTMRGQSEGYCQGMNFIVAIAVSVMTEEEALWVLAYFAEVLFPDYFGQLAGVVVDNQVLEWMVQRTMPALLQHLQDLGLSIAVLTTQWLVGVFSDTLPSEAVLQMWAAIIQQKDGHTFTLRIVLGMLQMLEEELMAIEDPQGVMEAKHHFVTSLFDVTPVLVRAEQTQAVFSAREIRHKRRQLKRYFGEELKARQLTDVVQEVATVTGLSQDTVGHMMQQFQTILRPAPIPSCRTVTSPTSWAASPGSCNSFATSQSTGSMGHISTPASRNSVSSTRLGSSSSSRQDLEFQLTGSMLGSMGRSSKGSSLDIEFRLDALSNTTFDTDNNLSFEAPSDQSFQRGDGGNEDPCHFSSDLEDPGRLSTETAPPQSAEAIASNEDLDGRFPSHVLLPPSLSDSSDIIDSGSSPLEINEEQFCKIASNLLINEYLDPKRLFVLLDSNGNGRLDFAELMAGLAVLAEGSWEQRLRLCFDSFDGDRKGHLDYEDLAEVLQFPLWRYLVPQVPNSFRRLSEMLSEALSPRPKAMDSKRSSMCTAQNSKRNSLSLENRIGNETPELIDSMSLRLRHFRLDTGCNDINDIETSMTGAVCLDHSQRDSVCTERRESISTTCSTTSSDSESSDRTSRRGSSLTVPMPRCLVDKDVLRTFEAMDLNGTDCITFAEFSAAVRANKKLSLFFERPLDTSKRLLWSVKDNRPKFQVASACQVCGMPFTSKVTQRAHHCRMCGAAVCAACSKHSLPLPLLGYSKPVRVCDACSGHEHQNSPSVTAALRHKPHSWKHVLSKQPFMTRQKKSSP